MRFGTTRPPRHIKTEALDGKTHHETLYGAMARKLDGYKLCIGILLAVLVWDRIERWPLLSEKQYVPVVMAEHGDGSMRFVGEPDPYWRPSDRNVIDELTWAVQTMRGRTKDAQFDQKLWQRLYDHSTEKGRLQLGEAYETLKKTEDQGRIAVDILSINKLSAQTFDVRWQERPHDVTNAPLKPSVWRGLFTVVLEVSTTLEGLRKNTTSVWLDGWSIAEDKTS